MKNRLSEIFEPSPHFSAEDFEKYAQGNLSPEELHQLQKHLIDCPLCDDALQGALLLQSKAQSPNIKFGIPLKTTREGYYWRGAAAILVVAFCLGGLLYWQKIERQSTLALAEQQQKTDTAFTQRETSEPQSKPENFKRKFDDETLPPKQLEAPEAATEIPDLDDGEMEETEKRLPPATKEHLSDKVSPAANAKPNWNEVDVGATATLMDELPKHQPASEMGDSKSAELASKNDERIQSRSANIKTDKSQPNKAAQENAPKAQPNAEVAGMLKGKTGNTVANADLQLAEQMKKEKQKTTQKNYFSFGLSAFKNKEYQEAIRQFNQAIELNPNDGFAKYYLAQSYIQTSRWVKAKKTLQAIIDQHLPEKQIATKTLDSLSGIGRR
jgi:tetratricopeptide (TPR) repeat protein